MENSDEQPTIEKILPVSTLEDSDAVIKSNGISQLVASTVMLVLYFIFRRKAPWVYYPNINNKPQHPCYQENIGLFNWLVPLYTTEDTQLLSMVGLDGFMFLQTIKLLYRICFILCLIVVPILCSWYYYKFGSDERTNQFFIKLSIWKIKDQKLYSCISILTYVITMIILYLVFIYYKRFVTLRQLYLSAPATMTSVSHLKKISQKLGSDQNAVDYINISSRTVLIDRLPNNIMNDKELMDYLKTLRIGEIESVSLVYDTYNLQKMYEERDEIIQDIEKEATLALVKVKQHYSDPKSGAKESFGDLWNEDLEKASSTLFDQMDFNSEAKVSLFNNFCKYQDKFLSKTDKAKSVIELNICRLRDVNERIIKEKNQLQETARSEMVEMPVASDDFYVNSNVRNDVSFFNLSQLSNMSSNKDLFTLDLPLNKKRAFVTFKDQKTAGITRQVKLGSRAFSSNVESAPAPNDVLWKNITKNEVTGFFFKIISLALYILFIAAFLFIVVKIIDSLQVKKNDKNLIFKLFNGNMAMIDMYEGIMVPLVYNILLYFVPIIIKALIQMEDINSYSGLQVKLMYRFSLFLFFNAFIATFITSLIVQYTSEVVKDGYTIKEAISQFSTSVIKSSMFFFNTIVQRLCVGSLIVVLKPSPFLYNFVLAPLVIYTRRQSREREFSPPIDFGNHIPNLLLIFPMALVYSCFCPLVLVISYVFFYFSYIVYKNELLYATRNEFESGGSYWKPTVRFILFSLITFQITNSIITYTEGFTTTFILYLPLIFMTFIFSEGLNMIFNKSCESFPLNAPEETYLDSFSKKTLEERFKILKGWSETDSYDSDLIPISELGFEDKKADLTHSYYKDPSTLVKIGNIILPNNFFKIVHFLKSFDQNNVYGMKK